MATKTTVNNKGVSSVRGAPNDQLVLDPSIRFIKGVQNVDPAASANITAPVVVFEGVSGSVTGTLPAISTDNLGLQHNVLNANTTFPIMVTGSNKINGAALGVGLTLSASFGKTFTAVSTSTGFQWIAI